MKTYYVQLKDISSWIEINADANPTLTTVSGSSVLYWQFMQGTHVVSQFAQAAVIGWWAF